MRRYLLDTTPLAAYLHGAPQAVTLIDAWLDAGEAATSILTYGEVIEYLLGKPDFRHRKEQLRQLLGAIPPFFLTYHILERYASIRRSLRKPHGPGLIGDIDTLVAATALEANLTLVTTDQDYERVPDLFVMLLDRVSLAVLWNR